MTEQGLKIEQKAREIVETLKGYTMSEIYKVVYEIMKQSEKIATVS